jgi:hypothetical protein
MTQTQIHNPPTRMTLFVVTEILSGNTIKVTPVWQWNNDSGNEIEINGLDLSNTNLNPVIGDLIMKQRLTNLIHQKEVVLATPAQILTPHKKLRCDVLLNGVNIAKYFPEFQKK